MVFEITVKSELPESRDMCHFAQVYDKKNIPRLFYDCDGVLIKHLIVDSLELLGHNRNEMGDEPDLVGKDYRFVGFAYGGLTDPDSENNVRKLVWTKIEDSKYGHMGLDITHFKDLTKKLNVEINLKHAGSSQGENQSGR